LLLCSRPQYIKLQAARRELEDVAVLKWFLASVAALSAYSALAFEATLSGVSDEDLKARLEGGSLLFEQVDLETSAPPRELVATAQADYKRLLSVLYEAGYFGASISIKLDGREAASISPVGAPPSFGGAQISIDTGRQFRFGRAEVAPVAPDTEIPEGFRSGEIAGLGILKQTVSAGIEGWRTAGHPKARLENQSLTARHADATLNADLALAPGPKLRFGPLSVSGNSAVRSERIVEIAGLPVGTTYSPQELDDATKRLRRTGTFSSVALVEADAPGPGDTIGMTVQVVEAKPRRFGFGAELESFEGLTLSTFWLHRNLLGGAERLRLEAEVSGLGGGFGGTDGLLRARFQRPATFNEDLDYYALGELEQLDEENFFSRQGTLETGFEYYASDQQTYRAGIGLRRAQTRDAFGENQYTLLLFPVGGTFDYRDDLLDPLKGFYAEAELSPFYAIAGADDGILSTLDLRGYRTFGASSNVTVAVRGQLGSLFGPALDVAPADFVFYSGGGGTVRGQDYQSLGVTLPDGEETGGRSFLGLSAEIRLRTSGALGYVGFVDAGYIGAEEFPDGSGEWQSGAGLGLRYATPIGPIRLDVAVPTTGPDDGNSFQVYVGIGQSF
jgi:translocation and assembly module TamA